MGDLLLELLGETLENYYKFVWLLRKTREKNTSFGKQSWAKEEKRVIYSKHPNNMGYENDNLVKNSVLIFKSIANCFIL